MKTKRKKSTLKKLIAVIFIVPVYLFFMPVKIVKSSVNADEYYIIRFVSEGSTDGGTCYVIGDQNGMRTGDDIIYVNLSGNDMRSCLSFGIYNSYTEFIVYGSLKEVPDENRPGFSRYELHSDKWGIYKKVNGGSHRYFITVYDLSWTNYFLDDVGQAYYEQSLKHR